MTRVMMYSTLFGMLLLDRVLPTDGAETPQDGVSALTLMIIVGLALVITFLARYLATRNNRKK